VSATISGNALSCSREGIRLALSVLTRVGGAAGVRTGTGAGAGTTSTSRVFGVSDDPLGSGKRRVQLTNSRVARAACRSSAAHALVPHSAGVGWERAVIGLILIEGDGRLGDFFCCHEGEPRFVQLWPTDPAVPPYGPSWHSGWPLAATSRAGCFRGITTIFESLLTRLIPKISG